METRGGNWVDELAQATGWRWLAKAWASARADARRLHRLLSTPARERYRQRWTLLLGQERSGKSSLVASLAWVREHGEAQAVHLPEAPQAAWHRVPGGELIDVAGQLSAAPPGSPEAQQWLRTLQGIAQQRPERALDAVVLTVSAASLLHGDAAQRMRIAQDARRQLQSVREQLRFVLPVYVVVTQCDAIEGFGAYWRAFDPSVRSQIQGWSAEGVPQQATAAQWEEAQATLVRRLKALQVQAAAEQPAIADADGFFLYPRHFDGLRDPVAAYLAEVFQDSEWERAFLCRGVYFTGNVQPPAHAPAAARDDIAFTDDLFLAKVMREPGQARITRQALFSHDGALRRLQQAAVAAACGLGIALAVTGWRVDAQVDSLTRSITQLRRIQAAAATSGTCAAKAVQDEALRHVAAMDTDMAYAVLPLSWVDRRPSQRAVQEAARHALVDTVYPALRCALEQRANALAAGLPQPVQTPLSGLPVKGSNYARIRATLQVQATVLRELEQNLARFALVTAASDAEPQRRLEALNPLVVYLYGSALPADVLHGRGAVLPALALARYNTPVAVPGGMRAQFAGELQTLAVQLQAALLNEVGSGPQWLAQIGPPPKGPLPLADSTRGFTAWLTWVGQAWVSSTPTENPCAADARELERQLGPLVENYRYPSSLLVALPLLGPQRCWKPAMTLLQGMRLERYGALMLHAGGQWRLNPELAAEMRGFAALLAQPYMQLPSPQPFACQHATTAWRTVDIGRAEGYVRDYQQFIAAQELAPLGAPPARQPLFAQVAAYQLEQAMNDAMQSAQSPAGAPPALQGLEAVSAADQQLLQQSQDFSRMLQPLLGVLRLYTQMGFARSGGLVAQCARDAAGDALGRITVLANQSRLYEPEAGPADGPVLVLGTTPVVRDYLARQVARAQVLTGYAEPFTALLRNTTGVNDAQAATPQTLTYWTNTIHELTRYVQFKDPAGQVGALDALFLKTVSDLTYANCAKSLAAYQPPEYGDDLFSARRRLLVARVTALCGNRQAAQSVEAFRRLAERFNAELAGRYPFGALDASAPEAGLGTVKAFFLDYDAQRPALDQALAGVDRAQWREAFAFIERLDAVSAFLRGSLTAANSQPLRMAVTFRALPNVPAGAAAEVSPGSNQIVGWSLAAGSRVINYPGLNPLVLDWPYGQAIELDLNWADRSLWRPVETPAGSALVVRGTTASFASGGNWALLRMLERFAPRRVPAVDPGNPNRALLEFSIPVVRTDGNARPGAPATAVIYLGLDLSAADPKTQSAAPVRWPGPFPRSAPEAPQPHSGARR